MLRQVPDVWQSIGAWCTKHRAAPTAEYMSAVLSPNDAGWDERMQLTGPDGNPISSHWAKSALAMQLLLVREPHAFMFPYGEPEATGDVIEAVLGICDPDRTKDRKFRDELAARWGLSPAGLRSLHGKLEDLIKNVAKLTWTAHHHPLAREQDCPRSFRDFDTCDFPLKASMIVVEDLIVPARLAALAEAPCAVCALSKIVTGSEVGLTPTRSRLRYMGGGESITGRAVNAPTPITQAPGIQLNPPAATPTTAVSWKTRRQPSTTATHAGPDRGRSTKALGWTTRSA